MGSRRSIALYVVGLAIGCGPGPAPQPLGTRTGTVTAAAGVAAQTGVAAYDFTVHDGGDAEIVLRGADGAARGTMVWAGSAATGASQTVIAADGSTAIASSRLIETADPSAPFWSRQRVDAAGAWLELDVEAIDPFVPQHVELAAAGAENLVVVDGGVTTAQPDAVQAWLGAAPLAALDDDAAARLLLIVRLDPALTAALAGATGAAEQDGVRQQAIHMESDCMLLSTGIGLLSGNCIACVGSFAAALPTAGLSTLLGSPTCLGCAGFTAATAVLLAACTQSQRNAPTLADCTRFCADGAGPAYEPGLDGTGHLCLCTCTNDRCQSYRTTQLHDEQTLCASGCDTENNCQARVQTCGDGVIDQLPGCAPEECDPGARPSGCPTGKGCVKCKCVDDAIDCGPMTCDAGQECHGCGFQLFCGAPGSTCCASIYGTFLCPPGTECRDCECLMPGQDPGPNVGFDCYGGVSGRPWEPRE